LGLFHEDGEWHSVTVGRFDEESDAYTITWDGWDMKDTLKTEQLKPIVAENEELATLPVCAECHETIAVVADGIKCEDVGLVYCLACWMKPKEDMSRMLRTQKNLKSLLKMGARRTVVF
jgi:hypothetical protein